MKTQQKLKAGPICLAVLFAATLVIAGCLGAAPGPVTATHETPGETHTIAKAIATRTTTAQALKTLQPTKAPGLSTAGIAINPVGDRKTGENFILTATTSLPEGTDVLWQILPDTGTPPTGLDGNSMMSVGGNNVVRKGDGGTNLISQDVNLDRLVPGKYVVIMGEMKGTFKDYEIGNRYGYTYFTLK